MESITTDDILGKTALDGHARVLGVVVKMHIDTEAKTILGITIDQGLTKPDLFVGLAHVKKFAKNAVFLHGLTFNALKGKNVISEDGERIGTVESVVHKNEQVVSITVNKKVGTFKSENTHYPASKIKEIGETIIVRK